MRQFTFVTFLAVGLVSQTTGVYWDDLRVTWGPGAPTDTSFVQMPRTALDAEAAGWERYSSDCENNGMYSGFRYTRPNETALNLIFDKNGIIAGMQALMPQNETMKSYRFDLTPMFMNETIKGIDFVVLTAYFVPQDSICSTGRTVFDLIEEGTGTGLWFQNGEDPSTHLDIPMERVEATNQGWTNCQCFPFMGLHNFFEVDTWQATNCDRVRPAHLIYSLDGELQGFVFQNHGRGSSPVFENPSNPALVAIIGESQIPQCTLDVNEQFGISPIHVYFIGKPWEVSCP